ncbi:RsmD family RNA methyltransferase [Ignisphaera sp. 4213-co]|uniref:tRNA (guanine(10)-N(2))-dimethyltransferase n=1 Tax=Ignisphaera cupida TaxID=3050454 RepID=A0ABD4Z3Y2_9CREN|nr:RsmD family RNA methyltransferase [Ignisphaera sp. 4213-co]MDK6027860.1 RsmD family RNA methyltransferase [Ignisphaera sp. 4213-co]
MRADSDSFVYSNVFVFKLSNELLSLALSELNSIIFADAPSSKIVKRFDEFVLIETSEVLAHHICSRASFIIEMGILKNIFDEDDIEGLSNEIKNYLDEDSVCVRFDAIRGFGKESIEKLSKLIEKTVWSRCKKTIKISFVGGLAIVYEVLYRRKEAKFFDREPHKRPCYRPGTMKPQLARALVNLAKISSAKNQIMLDPFCGVGGIVLEACSMGIQSLCSDIDAKMVKCASENMKYFGCCEKVDIILADASFRNIRGLCVDAIVTDPPYGIQSTPRGFSILDLLRNFIIVSSEVLKRNGYAVFAIPIQYEVAIDMLLADQGFKIKEKHVNRVHGSLTRVIYVVKKL